jgi:vacuolar-type H+-ATPase subunit E/Vma4
MALKNMVTYIQEQVHTEIEDQFNKAKIEATQSFIALGEELDEHQENKIYQITDRLLKQENMLKAEQDFIMSNKQLTLEQEFTEEFIQELKAALLNYTHTNKEKYQQILQSWLVKVNEALQGMKIAITVNERDVELIKQLLTSLSISGHVDSSPKIKAGLYVEGESGVIVDLTFNTLFIERKEKLLNISMQILKENL